MTTTNDITGDLIQSKPNSDNYRDFWDMAFTPDKTQTVIYSAAVELDPSLKVPALPDEECLVCESNAKSEDVTKRMVYVRTKFEDKIDAIDKEMADLDILLSLADIRLEILWVEKEYPGGGALHCTIEDGNFDDATIQYQINAMESGKWDGYAKDVADDDRCRFLKIGKDLLKMKAPYRELILNGTCITESVFNHLYNGDSIYDE